MAARVEATELPDGTTQFNFITRDGGHGDPIGVISEFDKFLHQTMQLARRFETPLGRLIAAVEADSLFIQTTGPDQSYVRNIPQRITTTDV